ncbi:MAG: M20 family metallopeptidase [Chloroflexi bacterium]|nr:M20 family metallopeptidase [Chloroflexota bacterium]
MTVTAYLESQLESYLADLQRLVAIDSGTYDKEGGELVIDWLAARLFRAGFAIQRFPQKETADHLLAQLRGGGRAKILLLGHCDTVYPRGTAAQRPLQLAGDRLVGPGTCDMKAGLLSGIYAIEALQKLDFNDFALLVLLCVADEEVDERTSISLILESIRGCDAVLTLEAARENGDIVTARKGNVVTRVRAQGRRAHAGVEPEKGRNAISGLMRRLLEVESLAHPDAGITINIGTIWGGTLPNVVPDQAEASIDIRAFEQDVLDRTVAEIEEVFARPAEDDINFTLDHRLASPPMPRTAEVARLEQLAVQAAGSLGFELRGVSTGGAADSAFAAQAGVPVLDGLGPIGGLDHGPDEYILKSSIVPRTALLAELIRLICGV